MGYNILSKQLEFAGITLWSFQDKELGCKIMPEGDSLPSFVAAKLFSS
jgi:hypothetical protein